MLKMILPNNSIWSNQYKRIVFVFQARYSYSAIWAT